MQSRPSVFIDSCFGFQAAIWHCLNHYAYPDAIFLAERLYAEGKFDDIYAITCFIVSSSKVAIVVVVVGGGGPVISEGFSLFGLLAYIV
jgi:hypothetical protein